MLLTETYKNLQGHLHTTNSSYGTSSFIYKDQINELIDVSGAKNALDYGCGKGLSKAFVNIPLALYDPCIKERAEPPRAADIVICTDVLEHIEPDCLDSVLQDLKRLTLSVGFFSIHTGPAVKVLADGRNAHLIQEDEKWWLPRLRILFNVVSCDKGGGGFYVKVTPRGE